MTQLVILRGPNRSIQKEIGDKERLACSYGRLELCLDQLVNFRGPKNISRKRLPSKNE